MKILITGANGTIGSDLVNFFSKKNKDYALNRKQNFVLKKIKKAKTDSSPIPESKKELEERSEALNLLTIYSDLTNNSLEKTLKEMNGKEFSYFKQKLSDVLIEIICPVGKKIRELMNDRTFLEALLKKGQEKASKKAEENLKKKREIVGLL